MTSNDDSSSKSYSDYSSSSFEDDDDDDEECIQERKNFTTEKQYYYSKLNNQSETNSNRPRVKVRCQVSPSGKKRTVYSYGIVKDVAGNRKITAGVSDVKALPHCFERDLTVSDQQPRYLQNTRAAMPEPRTRNQSEPFKKTHDEAYQRRTRTHIPQQKQGIGKPKLQTKCTGVSNAALNSSVATRRLLSARKLRIDDLRNRIIDLERKLVEDEKEKKILTSLCNRQQKELEKVEESRMEIPDLEKAHDNEVRALKIMVKKFQDKTRELEAKLKSKDEEYQRQFSMCKHLKLTLEHRKRIEGETDKRASKLKMKLENRDETIAMLKEKLGCSEKMLCEERMSHEADRIALKNMSKKYEELRTRTVDKKWDHVKYLSSPTSQESVEQVVKVSPVKCRNSFPREQEVQEQKTNVNTDEKKQSLALSIVTASTETLSTPEKQPHIRRPPSQERLFSPNISRLLNSPRNCPSSPTKPAFGPIINRELSHLSSPKFLQWASKSILSERKCASADSNKRLGRRMKQSHSDLSDLPLIIPSFIPSEPLIESDNSSSPCGKSNENVSTCIGKFWDTLQNSSLSKKSSQKNR